MKIPKKKGKFKRKRTKPLFQKNTKGSKLPEDPQDKGEDGLTPEESLLLLPISIPSHILKTVTGWSYEAAKALIISLLLVAILKTSVIEAFRIPSSSMAPTLIRGDRILVNKLAYDIRVPLSGWWGDKPLTLKVINEVSRGDVVVFNLAKDIRRAVIKRVVGLPGDRIYIKEGHLYINGKKVERKLIDPANLPELYKSIERLEIAKDPKTIQIFEEKLPGSKLPHHIFLDTENDRFNEMLERIVPDGNLFLLGDSRDSLNDSRFFGSIPKNWIIGKVMLVWLSFHGGNEGIEFRFRRLFKWIN